MLGLESQCVDIDECELEASSVCGPDAMCVNSEGSYQCIEPPTVVLRNECETGEANCGENAVCTDMEEGFNCDCGEGYEGDGFTCCDINECDQGTANCDEHALCINLPGYYYCICLYGYSGNGSTCNKLEEEEPSEEPDVDCTPGTPRSRYSAR
jgi:hypothetical protein